MTATAARMAVGAAVLAGLLLAGVRTAEGWERSPFEEALATVGRDYRTFYSAAPLARTGLALGGGALLANTSADGRLQDAYQRRLRSDGTDRVSAVAKNFGEGEFAFTTVLLAAGFNALEPGTRFGDWGVHASRAYLVGLPPMLVLQRALGSSRPSDNNGSRWRFADRAAGVSGHAFVGAVPFLALARVYEDRPVIRYTAVAASLLTAWSRVNDDAHYVSQAGLGWFLAWESVRATFVADGRVRRFAVQPAAVGPDGFGLVAHLAW